MIGPENQGTLTIQDGQKPSSLAPTKSPSLTTTLTTPRISFQPSQVDRRFDGVITKRAPTPDPQTTEDGKTVSVSIQPKVIEKGVEVEYPASVSVDQGVAAQQPTAEVNPEALLTENSSPRQCNRACHRRLSSFQLLLSKPPRKSSEISPFSHRAPNCCRLMMPD